MPQFYKDALIKACSKWALQGVPSAQPGRFPELTPQPLEAVIEQLPRPAALEGATSMTTATSSARTCNTVRHQ